MNLARRRIEICGNIASGKTALCKTVSAFGYHPLYESFSANPFLTAFYQDPLRFSFETEITFLLLHYHSIKTAKMDGLMACDFSLVLDKAYADVTLSRRRKKLFLDIAQELDNEIGPPQRVIHLKCPENILLSRIRERNRHFEEGITLDYLRQITHAIEIRISEISKLSSVITIDSHEVNFIHGLDEIPYLEKLNPATIIPKTVTNTEL